MPNPSSPIPNPAHMQHAIRVAWRNVGNTGHRPSVGCVLVKDGQVIAAACTGEDGIPHAEARALELAGEAARGATAYVTLEPCAHHGRTPPCAEALVKAGIKRVIIACTDPDPRVSGKGIAILEEAGIEVETGLCQAEAHETLAGFFSHLTRKRPLVTLKVATSADHIMALREGENPTITGEQARRHVHFLRSQHDAILTGIGTVLVDDPLLTCRLSGLEGRSPIRIVLDRNGKLPEDSRLVKTADDVPLWVVGKKGIHVIASAPHTVIPAQAGIFMRGADQDSRLRGNDKNLYRSDDIGWLLGELAEHNITRLMVEAGPTLSRAFIESGMVDQLYAYCAPHELGERAHPTLPTFNAAALAEQHNLTLTHQERLGKDNLKVYGAGCKV